MLYRKPTSFTDLSQNWGRLTESFTPKKPATTRGRNGELLLETKLGVDGHYYGIIQESDGYFIKTAPVTGLAQPGPDDFQYIGGRGNRNLERFASLPKAQHRVHLKLHSLNESVQPKVTTTQPAGEVDDLLQQLEAAPALPAAVPQPAPAVAAPDPALDPLAGAAAPAPALPADPAAAAALPGEDPAAAGVDPALPPAEGEDDGDEMTADKLLSLVGKLGAGIDKLGPNVTPQLAKSVLNPTITHLAPGINAMDGGEREEIAGRLTDGAKPLDEALAPETAALQARNAAGRTAWENLPQTNPGAYANATRQLVPAPLTQPITGRSAALPTTYAPDYDAPSRANQAHHQNQATAQRQAHQQGLGPNAQGFLPGDEAKYQLDKAAQLRGAGKQLLPEDATGASETMLTEAESEATQALDDYQNSPGSGGRFHSQAKMDELQQAVEDAQHALKHYQWMQKMPQHPRQSLNETYINSHNEHNYTPEQLALHNAREQAKHEGPTGYRATAADLQNQAATTRQDGSGWHSPESRATSVKDDLAQAAEMRQKAASREVLPEGYIDDEDNGEDPALSEYADGFRTFCEARGYDPYTDEGLATAVQAWAKKVGGKKSPYNPDIEGVADVMNPYVWGQIKPLLPPAFAAQVEQEVQANAATPAAAPLTEGLQVLLRGLIQEQVNSLKNPEAAN